MSRLGLRKAACSIEAEETELERAEPLYGREPSYGDSFATNASCVNAASPVKNFGGGILTASGAASDIFIASFDRNGIHLPRPRPP